MQKPRPFYGLMFLSVVLKIIAVGLVIFAIGIAGYLSVYEVNTIPRDDISRFVWWAERTIPLLLGFGLTAFFSLVLSQILDTQITINKQLRALSENDAQVAVSLDNLTTEVKRQNLMLKRVRLSAKTITLDEDEIEVPIQTKTLSQNNQ